MCKQHDLVIATTQYDIGDTYYGNEGEAFAEHASKIDHIAIPSQAAKLIRGCTALRRSGARLQLIRKRGSRDHLTVMVEFENHNNKAEQMERARLDDGQKVDRDKLMECLRKGRKAMRVMDGDRCELEGDHRPTGRKKRR